MTSEEASQQAKINALRSLQAAGLFDAKTDNPQNLNLVPPQETMQANPSNLVNAMQGTDREQQLKDLFNAAKQ